MMMDNEIVLQNMEVLWQNYFTNNTTIFITGATGFFGKNIIESFLYINKKLGINVKLIALTRDVDNFISSYPQFNDPSILFLNGDLTNFEFPNIPIDYIIHAANDLYETNYSQNIESRPMIVGTKRVLELAKIKKVKSLLYTSSGAIYGKMPYGELIKESQQDIFKMKLHSDYYAQNKSYIEYLCGQFYNEYSVPSKIARCFAFVGKYLPMDIHYAIGNFIKDYLDKKDILIKGNGLVHRSYLYSADLCIWLLTILLKGENCRPYNVGSDEYYTLHDVALKVINYKNSSLNINIIDKNTEMRGNWYIPSISRAKLELGLSVYTSLDNAIERTIDSYFKEK
jgi:dTDP-glucose 4,6-dehydratase